MSYMLREALDAIVPQLKRKTTSHSRHLGRNLEFVVKYRATGYPLRNLDRIEGSLLVWEEHLGRLVHTHAPIDNVYLGEGMYMRLDPEGKTGLAIPLFFPTQSNQWSLTGALPDGEDFLKMYLDITKIDKPRIVEEYGRRDETILLAS